MNEVRRENSHFDLVVVGSGPAGHAAAMEAGMLGARVAVVERSDELGGDSNGSGDLPVTTFRAAVMEATGAAQARARREYRGDDSITLDDLLWRVAGVVDRERRSVRDDLRRRKVTIITGHARFVGPGLISVGTLDRETTLVADRVIIATGSRPPDDATFGFDDTTVLDADSILGLRRIPETMTVIGAGVVGLEYSSIFAALGTRVTVIEQCSRILTDADEQIADTLLYHLRGIGIRFLLGRAATSASAGHSSATASCRLDNGEEVVSDVVLVAAGRRGDTDGLQLETIGVAVDGRGRILVDQYGETTCGGVFAAGEVVGSPTLSLSGREQGRRAARRALGAPEPAENRLVPTGIYTIPEVSFVGHCEGDLSDAGVPYVRGLAHYRELARGEIAGDRVGLLKLLVHRDSRTVLGVHIFGTAASELIHIGQTVMAAGLPVDFLLEASSAGPTYAEAYLVAASDAIRQLAAAGTEAA